MDFTRHPISSCSMGYMSATYVSILAIVFGLQSVCGNLPMCGDEEGRWQRFDKCLQKFYKDTRKHNVQSTRLDEKTWYEVCKYHHTLIKCHYAEISPCPRLMHKYERDLPAELGWSVAYINGTCDAMTREMEERRLKKNVNGTKPCQDLERRLSTMVECTSRFQEVFDHTEKKLDLCVRFYTMVFCHRHEARDCWPLLEYIREVRDAPDSVYEQMGKANCPDPNSEHVRNDPDYWQKRQAFEMKRQEEYEKKKVEHRIKYGKDINAKPEPSWLKTIPLWGKISLGTIFGSIALAPFIIIFMMLYR